MSSMVRPYHLVILILTMVHSSSTSFMVPITSLARSSRTTIPINAPHKQRRFRSQTKQTTPTKQQLAAHKPQQDQQSSSSIPTSSPALSSTQILLLTIGILFSTCIAGAVTGIMPGYTAATSTTASSLLSNIFPQSTPPLPLPTLLLLQDMLATITSTVLAFAYVQSITYAQQQSWIPPADARKFIHIGAAPLFICVWPLFTTGGRFFASSVSILNGVRLLLSANSNSALATAVSRSGDTQEAVEGPLVYCIVLTLAILLFWRSSPAGIVAMGTLAAGDGMADVIGRRWGKSNPWPGWVENKSMVGTVAFVVAGSIMNYGLLSWMHYTGCLTMEPVAWGTIVLITTICAFVELFPGLDDNYTVPISAALLSMWLIH